MKQVLDDKFFEIYFIGTNFGTTKYSDLILEGLLKVSCCYYNGMTLDGILLNYNLITITGKKNLRKLTSKGCKYLYQLIEQKEIL